MGVTHEPLIKLLSTLRNTKKYYWNTADLLSLALLRPALIEIRYSCSHAWRILSWNPKAPSTLRPSEVGMAACRTIQVGRGLWSNVIDRARATGFHSIVDPFHVEAGKGVRTCMPRLSSSGKPFACLDDCVDGSTVFECGSTWHSAIHLRASLINPAKLLTVRMLLAE